MNMDLIRAVVAAPDEDTPRLVFADWLDDNDSPEWAELIRTQIDNPNPSTSLWTRIIALVSSDAVVRDIRRLVVPDTPDWDVVAVKVANLSDSEASDRKIDAIRNAAGSRNISGQWTLCQRVGYRGVAYTLDEIARGFPTRLSADVGSLTGSRCPYKNCGPATPIPGCPVCGGSGRRATLTAEIFSHLPVTDVVVEERTYIGGWVRADPVRKIAYPSILPPDLFDELDLPLSVRKYHGYGLDVKEDPLESETSSMLGLNAAALRYGRKLAGLPPQPKGPPCPAAPT